MKHLYWMERAQVLKSVPLLICDFSYHQDLRRFTTGILSTRSVQTCALINTTKCFFIGLYCLCISCLWCSSVVHFAASMAIAAGVWHAPYRHLECSRVLGRFIYQKNLNLLLTTPRHSDPRSQKCFVVCVTSPDFPSALGGHSPTDPARITINMQSPLLFQIYF